jgi:flavin-dependent dehydrogenase
MSVRKVERPGSIDVAVCGGGLAGLLLARQLRRELPELSVTVLERTRRPLPDACHKVGESSVELASQHLEHLGLGPYLLERQIIKMGLRFFPGGGHLPLVERTEIGPCNEPVVRSYQLDRGRLENDLRGFIEEDGATLIEGARVNAVEFGSGAADHVVSYDVDGVPRELRARWVVDATGRNALLRRKLKLTRGLNYPASAGWYRVEGRVDLNDMVPASEKEWHSRPRGPERWRSTNHFMGKGYWAWLIPLSTNHTSVGLVIHDTVHPHQCISSLENVFAFLAEHEPHLWKLLEGRPAKDFLCLRKYCHGVGRAWSEERWAMVGEAGAFVDPLYSPGSDFITLANCFTVEMIRTERAGGDLRAKSALLNSQYHSLVKGTTDLFRNAAPVMGHPGAMAAKVFWDNLNYWSFTCHFYQQGLYRLDLAEYEPFGRIGRRLLELGDNVQRFLSAWAELAPMPQQPVFIGAPHFPSVLIDAHTRVAQKMTKPEFLEYLELRLRQIEEIAGEIVLRVVQEVGPVLGRELLERTRFPSWGLHVPPERLETEARTGHARRTRLSTIARDLERTMGKVERHPQAHLARELLTQTAAS